MTNPTPARVQPGVPAGGQFSAASRSEADVNLDRASDPEALQRQTQSRYATALAAHLELDGDDVELYFDNRSACGRPHQHADARCEIPLPSDRLNTAISVNAELAADGTAVATSVMVSYDLDPADSDGYDRSSVSINSPRHQPVPPEDLPRVIEAARVKAHLQRSAEFQFNLPQRQRNATEDGHRGYFDIVSLDICEVTDDAVVVQVQNGTRTGSPAVRLTLDPATGSPVSGTMDTDLGLMTLEGENLRRATGTLYRDLSLSLGEHDHLTATPGDQWSAKLTQRFARLLGVGPR